MKTKWYEVFLLVFEVIYSVIVIIFYSIYAFIINPFGWIENRKTRCHYCFQPIDKGESMVRIYKTSFDVYNNEYLSGYCYYHSHCYEEEQKQIANYEEAQKTNELKC